MTSTLSRSHVLIAPLVLLLVILVEEVLVFELRAEVTSVPLRTGLIMILYGPGIALVANVVSPRLKKALVKARSKSRSAGGRFGILLFFALAYVGMFWAYYVLETVGVSGLF
jgi:hypothetical protein